MPGLLRVAGRSRRCAGRLRAVTRRPRLLRLLLCVVAVLVLAGCRVQLTTDVKVDADGSGTITQGIGFDDGALKRVGDPALALRADDLRQAGWVVDPAVREGDLTWVRAHHDFATPAEGTALLAQLSGPDGPYRDMVISRSTGMLSSTESIKGEIDTTAGLAMFGDAQLAAALGGDASGGLLAKIEKEEGRPAASMVGLTFAVDINGTKKSWNATFVDGGVQLVKASASESHLLRIFETILVILLVLLTVTVIALRIRARRLRTRRLMRRSRRW